MDQLTKLFEVVQGNSVGAPSYTLEVACVHSQSRLIRLVKLGRSHTIYRFHRKFIRLPAIWSNMLKNLEGIWLAQVIHTYFCVIEKLMCLLQNILNLEVKVLSREVFFTERDTNCKGASVPAITLCAHA